MRFAGEKDAVAVRRENSPVISLREPFMGSKRVARGGVEVIDTELEGSVDELGDFLFAPADAAEEVASPPNASTETFTPVLPSSRRGSADVCALPELATAAVRPTPTVVFRKSRRPIVFFEDAIAEPPERECRSALAFCQYVSGDTGTNRKFS